MLRLGCSVRERACVCQTDVGEGGSETKPGASVGQPGVREVMVVSWAVRIKRKRKGEPEFSCPMVLMLGTHEVCEVLC